MRTETRDVAVFGGKANFGGGGIFVSDGGGLTLTRSTIANNRVKANPSQPQDSARGGGISYHFSDQPLNATNTTITSNTVDSSGNTVNATFGGAIDWSVSGQMNLTNVTIANNSATGGDSPSVVGGGIDLLGTGANLRQTILAGNHAPSDADCFEFLANEAWTSAGHNVIGDTSGCDHTTGTGDVLNVAPSLGPLASYGGPTVTQLPNPGSPAIDRGGTCPTTDQRGFLRGAEPPCDAGAVEVGALPPGKAKASIRRTGQVVVGTGGRGRLVVRTGTAASCPRAGTTCRGSAVIDRAVAASRPASGSGGQKPLGRVGLSVQSGRTQAVEVALTGSASRELRRTGRLRVTIAITLTGPAGPAATLSRRATLKPPKRGRP
ncbi:MAG: choice-of-anchor Q domain-containing protein [Solirubrobacterales bacterium]